MHFNPVAAVPILSSAASVHTLPSRMTDNSSSTMEDNHDPFPDWDSGGDGAVDRVWRRSSKQPVAAIFIHAGAGYHSTANEKVHLEACSEAARVGMKFLKAGATASEAVEAAIKCLEDKEITNAGFGSNLNMDGVVECDATIVDHLGRSGACGAVPGIKNPISLAKLILDSSSRPLTLRRVPPNILVGLGARSFGEKHGMLATPNKLLVSKNANDRYMRWSEDLKKAEARMAANAMTAGRYESVSRAQTPSEYERAARPATPTQRRDHTNAILTGTWNEGQPDSPDLGALPTPETVSPMAADTPLLEPRRSASMRSSTTNLKAPADKSPLSFMSSAFSARVSQSVSAKRQKLRKSLSDDVSAFPCRAGEVPPSNTPMPNGANGANGADGTSHDGHISPDKDGHVQDRVTEESGSSSSSRSRSRSRSDGDKQSDCGGNEDLVTDTIGAIAVDLKGNIAAGSSSGGIGMKHRGRIGPAALVGIGTAVVPEDIDDENGTSVAAVTSGTGEHMATSLASARCAERLFHSTRRGPGGRNIEEYDDRTLMEAFIIDDFMGHPGVKNQPSAGAIGVMAVKKDRRGIYFYFAHNTDSFALASMASTEREPGLVMSRLHESRSIAHGGRKIRIDSDGNKVMAVFGI